VKDHSPRFWRVWQIVLFVLYGVVSALMLFGHAYSSMVENSSNPRLTHVVSVLTFMVIFVGSILVLGRKYEAARKRAGGVQSTDTE